MSILPFIIAGVACSAILSILVGVIVYSRAYSRGMAFRREYERYLQEAQND